MNSRLKHQIITGGIALLFIWLFWLSRPEWSWDMRLWKSIGDAAFILLFITLVIGPITRLWPFTAWVLPWRKYTGIWFGLLAIIHGFLIWNGWARWELTRFLGYEYVPELGRIVRLEPGFGLANLIGVIALFMTLVLMATSSELAVKHLGGNSWKYIHYSINTIFYLSAVHAGYFLYIHYTLSFHKNVPPPDWFRVPFLIIVAIVLLLQLSAFVKTVRSRKRR